MPGMKLARGLLEADYGGGGRGGLYVGLEDGNCLVLDVGCNVADDWAVTRLLVRFCKVPVKRYQWYMCNQICQM